MNVDRLQRNLISHKESANCVQLTRDGNFCMSASNDRTVKLWNPHKDDPIIPNQGLMIKSYGGSHGYSILDVAISSDNSRFVSAGGDK